MKKQVKILPSQSSAETQFNPMKAIWANLRRDFSSQSLSSESVLCSTDLHMKYCSVRSLVTVQLDTTFPWVVIMACMLL